VGKIGLSKSSFAPVAEIVPNTVQSASKGFVLVGEGSLRSASVVRRGQTLNRVFDSRWRQGFPYSQPMGGSFSPGSTLPTSASQTIVERGLNWPGITNNAQFGVIYKASGNVPSMVRTSLGGTTPEIEIAKGYRFILKEVGETGNYIPLGP
jgi:hypothetical protein